MATTAGASRPHLEARALRYARGWGGSGDLSRLSEAELTRLVDGLDRTAHPCGCKEGAVGVSAAFVLWPLWVMARRRPHSLAGWLARCAELAPVTAGAALTFKGAGIARGRAEHLRLRGTLSAAARGPGPERLRAPAG